MMLADPRMDYRSWDYIEGDFDMSIATQRLAHLNVLNRLCDHELIVALKDPETDAWTKWLPLNDRSWVTTDKNFYRESVIEEKLRTAYDIHRSILPFEIIAESDYEEYEQNSDALRLLGQVIEHQGFEPLYYYSGNKGIHLQAYFDFKCLLGIDMFLQRKILERFEHKSAFVKEFMEWLRGKIIRCWDLRLREFDEHFIKSRHLIRCELSRHKLGHKTFLGYSYKDISFIPYICNSENKIYPRLGEIKLSRPHRPQELVEEFLESLDKAERVSRVRHKEASLQYWLNPGKYDAIRPCVSFLLSEDFKAAGDGYQRAMFILANELRRLEGPEAALDRLRLWNGAMGFKVRAEDIEYRLRKQTQEYQLSCAYVHDFLRSLGFPQVAEACDKA